MSKSSEQQLLDDIRDHFQSFKCTLQDLRAPTEEFVTNFYSFWLQEFEVDITNISQVQFSQTSVTNPYPDAYSGTIPRMNLLMSIRAFDILPDFGILDIISPTPKRTQTLIRACIDFYLSSDYRVCCILAKKKKLNERKEKISKMSKERQDLKVSLNNAIKSIAQIQDAKKQLEEEAVILQKKTSEMQPEKQIAKSKTDESTEKLKEAQMILQKINKEDSQISTKLKEFSNLIVDSPSSILNDLESLRVKHEEIKDLAEQKQGMVKTRTLNQSSVHKASEDQLQRSVQLNDLVRLIDQQRELLDVVQTTDKNTMACQEVLNELKSTLLALGTKRANRQEQLQSSYLRWKTLKPQLTESVEAAIRELTEKKNEKNKIKTSLKEDSVVQEEIDSLLTRIKKFIEDFQDDYTKMVMDEREYYRSLEETAHTHMQNTRKMVNKKYPKQ